MVSEEEIRINKSRLESNLKELALIGLNEKGGIDRTFGSETDIRAREWIKSLWKNKLDLALKVDPIANIWGHKEGREKLPPIVLGSHHDAVANGGKYDGALGVLLATEIMETIKENNLTLRHPLELVSFSAEEPNPFNLATLGSKTIAGKLSKEKLKGTVDKINNIKLEATVLKLGGNLDKLEEAFVKEDELAAFIECHIEQGRNLYDKGISLGVVTKITGIYREQITVKGEANHAGTTLMKYRHDSVLAAAEVCLALESAVNALGREDVVGTIGYVNVFPNSANIIAGEVSLTLEIRSIDPEAVKAVLSDFTDKVNEIAARRGVKIERDNILNQREVAMDEVVRASLRKAAELLSEPYMELPSMAGHDAAHVAKVAKAGMIFVPSIDGKSHCAEEKTDISDIEKAGNAMLKAVLILDKELDSND